MMAVPFFINLGSSPRMRGARNLPRLDNINGRIIPAYAGSTGSFTCFASASGDHPRVCGEHTKAPRAM